MRVGRIATPNWTNDAGSLNGVALIDTRRNHHLKLQGSVMLADAHRVFLARRAAVSSRERG